MGIYTIKMPDVGEGIAEAELVEWSVAPGDVVREDDIIAAVMTDKATVEIPSSVEGTILWLGAAIGESIAVGADLVRIETEGAGNTPASAVEKTPESPPPPQPEAAPAAKAEVAPQKAPAPEQPVDALASPSTRRESERPLAAPSVRKRAKDTGVDLSRVHGTGKAGRITHEDLEAYLAGRSSRPLRDRTADDSVKEIKVIGLRRKIAERMANAKRRIPHITIVEEVDVTAVEDLRKQLNNERQDGKAKLTLLPFLMATIVRAVRQQPALNAHFDDEAEVVREFNGVHIGIATQTDNGLMVPVVRHCEMLSLWDSAAEIARIAEAARKGTAKREELSGSTITITSLGPLGAIATTPIINHPEVAIVGVNRMAVRPWWNGTEFEPRTMMNLSCSFDHRVIDGWDAALFVKRLKTLLEQPAMIFVES